MRISWLFVVCVLLVASALPAADVTDASHTAAADYLRAIQANDLAALRALCKTNPGGVRDRLDYTPLHYAALYGSTEALRIVLEAGGDPNARNKTEATPLMYAAWSLERTRRLVERGGEVNATAKDGSTALWVAEAAPGNEGTVRYLIDKGADLKALHPGGTDYLMRAAAHQSASVVRLLLAKGLDPHRADQSGDTALLESLVCDGGEKARLLIEAGSDVNAAGTDAGRVKNGPIEATGETPLMQAAACGETETVAALLKAGARIDRADTVRHMTALMRAIAMDGANPATVALLISSGADINVADRNSETALDWARKFGSPAVVRQLEKSGAREKGLVADPVRPAGPAPTAREAIDRASGLLAKSSEVFFREGGGCVGCHHQPFAGRAFGALKEAGLTPEPRLRQILIDGMVADRAREMNPLQLLNKGGGGYTSFLYPLAAMADMGGTSTEFTDVMVHLIAESQEISGAWGLTGSRAPLQESTITGTMLAVYALKSYEWPARRAEFAERVGRAREWLLTAQASTFAEEADRLMGLWQAGSEEIRTGNPRAAAGRWRMGADAVS
jgi:ankyrin repeat protein